MPTYTFYCPQCELAFELWMTMGDYTNQQSCPECESSDVHRHYSSDFQSITPSVRKGDGEITVGHLASRNRDRLSTDEKRHIFYKNNKYRFQDVEGLPTGMKHKPITPEKAFQRFMSPRKKKQNVPKKEP